MPEKVTNTAIIMNLAVAITWMRFTWSILEEATTFARGQGICAPFHFRS